MSSAYSPYPPQQAPGAARQQASQQQQQQQQQAHDAGLASHLSKSAPMQGLASFPQQQQQQQQHQHQQFLQHQFQRQQQHQQHQQQQQSFHAFLSQAGSAAHFSALDSSLLAYDPQALIKQEPGDASELGVGVVDPTDPFALSSDFSDLSSVLVNQQQFQPMSSSSHHQQVHHQQLMNQQSSLASMSAAASGMSSLNGAIGPPRSVLSPLSVSPLDHDFENLDDFTPHSASSLGGSPYGSIPMELQNHAARLQQTPTPAASAPRQLSIPRQGSLPQASNGGIMSAGIQQPLRSASGTSAKPPSLGSSSSSTHMQQPQYSISMPVHTAASGFAAAMDARNNTASPAAQFGTSSSSLKDNASSVSGSILGDEDSKTLDILNEKRRRRRESHNAVERRRRDNINEKIQELSILLPDQSDAMNKGSILRRSVEYIKMMQALATRQQERMRELENCVRGLLMRSGLDEQDLMLTVPLGTVFELPQMSPGNDMRD